MRLFDFQVSRLHSPAIDVAYFFYMSAPKHVMDEVDKYLKIYYDSFANFLKELGSDPGLLFPFDAFLSHWKKYREFGLAMALCSFRFVLSEGDDVLDFTTKEGLIGRLYGKMSNQNEQDKRVIDVVRHFVKTEHVNIIILAYY